VPYVGRYVMHSCAERRAGGQAIVQFAHAATGSAQQYAIKFYIQQDAFARERDLYMQPILREMMPATQEIISNEAGRIRTPGGFVFPPAIVIEKGESLDVWANREAHDFSTLMQARDLANAPAGRVRQDGTSRAAFAGHLFAPARSLHAAFEVKVDPPGMRAQVLCHVTKRLEVLHAAGWVHRDLKPGNVLRRPEQHSWTLIEYGCTARAGALPHAGKSSAPHPRLHKARGAADRRVQASAFALQRA
jgi:hypothetical protein